jgi:hypothetical protein
VEFIPLHRGISGEYWNPEPVEQSWLTKAGSTACPRRPSERADRSARVFSRPEYRPARGGSDGEGRIRPEAFFYRQLGEVDEIAYRQEVMKDLEHPGLFARIGAFAEKMKEVRSYLRALEEAYYRLHKNGWLLDAAAIYCAAVRATDHGPDRSGAAIARLSGISRIPVDLCRLGPIGSRRQHRACQTRSGLGEVCRCHTRPRRRGPQILDRERLQRRNRADVRQILTRQRERSPNKILRIYGNGSCRSTDCRTGS